MVASGAQVALLDEPTAAMDAVAEHEAMTLLSELRARYNMAVIVVSHHLEEALEHADRVVFFDPDAGVVINDTPRGLQARPEFLARYGAHLNEVQGQVHHGEVGGGASHPSTRSHGHGHGHGNSHGHGHGHGPGKGPGETEPS
jgi:ABC-type Mn2+/Zn2+ transport system ATPase subunit